MVFFNYSTMQMAAKVVYYGPGLCGKTTNLHHIYSHTSTDSRGEMVSLETETDRTLFFDLLPIDVGSIAGFKTRIQLYTVPGQVFYNTTRKLVLKGVDGVVFVADSQRPMQQSNLDSLNNLAENLAEMGLAIDNMPLVLQYNKRDLPDVATVDEMNRALNRSGWEFHEASAIGGQGVFETLKGISKLTLMSLKKRLTKTEAPAPRPAASAAAPPPPPPARPAVAVAPPAAAPPAPPAPSAPPPLPRATPAAAPAAAEAKGRTQVDVLRELEKIRRQTLRPAAPPGRSHIAGNGLKEMSRDVQLTLKQSDFERARRFTLNLQVEDGERRVVDAIRDLHVDLDSLADLKKVLVRLNIALNAKE
jgi:signal recognition particle receptor subunit beta